MFVEALEHLGFDDAGRRTHPCDAGYEGTYEYSCIAIPPTKYEAYGIQVLNGTDQDMLSLRYTRNEPVGVMPPAPVEVCTARRTSFPSIMRRTPRSRWISIRRPARCVVGRGAEASYCLLISDANGDTAKSRMGAMVQTGDGFQIAEMDLQLRGPGEFFGTRQHGLPEFKLADVTNEMDLLQQAKEDALALLADDPKLTKTEHRHLRAALVKQLGETLSLAQIG